MRAGPLDRRITIQRKSSTASGSGEPVETWSTIAERLPAVMRPVRGDERFTGEQVVGQEQVEFRIRYSTALANLGQLDRVIYPALADESPEDEPDLRNVYEVLAVHELVRREVLQIITQRRADVVP